MKNPLSSILTKPEQKIFIFLITFGLIGAIYQYFTKRITTQKISEKQIDSILENPPKIVFDIRTITKTELVSLPRIGAKTAELILAEREFFKKLEDIKKVKGIGDKTFEVLKDYFIPFGDETQQKNITEKQVLDDYNQSVENIKIDVNNADIEQLMLVSGIGKTKAKRIVDYRVKHGNFKSPKDLLNVNGIGEKTLKKIKNQIEIK